MNSAIYRGCLRHRRYTPRAHAFRYRLSMLYLDLAELPSLLDKARLWSTKGWAPGRFKRSDFLGDPALPLDDAVRQRIQQDTGEWHEGPIRMLANLRYFGFIINPIVCYYCFDEQQRLRYIVAEVTNTPWNERHSYVLPCEPEQDRLRIQFNKQMHVSPFNPMDMVYDWNSDAPEQKLRLHMRTLQQQQAVFDATLIMQREEISPAALDKWILSYPWMTVKVAAGIYWQALKLFLKRVPLYDHPATAGESQRVKHPPQRVSE